jgi:hypothetical protein
MIALDSERHARSGLLGAHFLPAQEEKVSNTGCHRLKSPHKFKESEHAND